MSNREGWWSCSQREREREREREIERESERERERESERASEREGRETALHSFVAQEPEKGDEGRECRVFQGGGAWLHGYLAHKKQRPPRTLQ